MEKLLGHRVEHSSEPLGPLRASGREVDLQQPRLEVILKNDVKSVDLKQTLLAFDLHRGCQEGVLNNFLDPRKNSLLPGTFIPMSGEIGDEFVDAPGRGLDVLLLEMFLIDRIIREMFVVVLKV